MKRLLSFTALYACLLFLNAQAQTFQEYLAEFPTITGMTTWQDADMLAYPSSDKKVLDPKYYTLIGGGGEWGNRSIEYRDNTKAYPLGKIEKGGTVIVFILATSSAYKADDNTQMAIDVFSYNKKNGNLLRGGRASYFMAFGGDAAGNTFMYAGKVETDGATWCKTYQTGTGSAVTGNRAYKISSKGLTYDKDF